MPNWCTCELWVSGDEQSIRRFLEEIVPLDSAQENDDEKNETEGYLIKTFGFLQALDSLRLLRNENGCRDNVNDTVALPPIKILEAFLGKLTKEEEASLGNRFHEWLEQHPFDIETKLELQEPRKLFFTFLTRSRTPLEAFKRISQLRPDLTFDLDWWLELQNDTGIIRFVNGTEKLIEDRVDHGTMGDWIEECVANYKVELGPDSVFRVNGEQFVDLDDHEGSAKLVAMLQWLHDRSVNGDLSTQDNPAHMDPPASPREFPYLVVFSDDATGKHFTLGTSRSEGFFSMILTLVRFKEWYKHEDLGSQTSL